MLFPTRLVRASFPTKTPFAMIPKAFGEEFPIRIFGAGAAPAFEEEGDFLIVHVDGPLVQHSEGPWGNDSFDAIRGRVREAVAKSDRKKAALVINSPGGSFAGCLELSREIRQIFSDAGKELFAFTDSQALSAGYALASAAKKIYVTPSASVGSIGVWSMLADVTKLDSQMGVSFHFIASDAAKVDRNPHVGISEEAVERLQSEVDTMAGMFRENTSKMRGRGSSPEDFKALKGASIFGRNALAVGLADAMVDCFSEFLRGDKKIMGAYSKAAISKAAEEGDEEAKKALAAMAKAEEDDEKMKKAKAKEEEDEKKAKEEEEAKKAASAKAEKDAPIKDGDKEDEKMGKKALEIAMGLQAKAEAEEREEIFAAYEVPEKAKASLSKLPISDMRDALEGFPKKAAVPFNNPMASGGNAMPKTTPAKAGEFDMANLNAEEKALLGRMGGSGVRAPFALGVPDREGAAAFLKKLDAERAAANGGK